MKFKFSLAPVLKVREHREKMQQQRLAEKVKAQQIIRDKHSAIASELEEFLRDKESHLVYDIQQLKSSYAHLEQTHGMMEKLSKDIQRAEKAIRRERDKLLVAHRDTHIMEKAKEREFEVFKQQVERKDRHLMDEITVQMINR